MSEVRTTMPTDLVIAQDLANELAELATVVPVNEEVVAVVSQFGETDEAGVGNVLRRTCMALGVEACKEQCQLSALRDNARVETNALTPLSEKAEPLLVERVQELVRAENEDGINFFGSDMKMCADENLDYFLDKLDVDNEQALIVSVGANDSIGYLDESQGALKQHEQGWFEIASFNAFFARTTEVLSSGSEAESDSSDAPIALMGARLADSGFVAVTMKDSEGVSVTGIIHSTRTNMLGRDHLKEYDGVQQTYIHHVVSSAMQHYGAKPEDVTMRLVAAVGPEAWRKRYPNLQTLEGNLPGWADDGLIINHTNPEWRSGQAVTQEDELWPQYPHLIKRDMVEAAAKLGIDNVKLDNELNPGKPPVGMLHSSQAARQREDAGTPVENSRDLYAVLTV